MNDIMQRLEDDFKNILRIPPLSIQGILYSLSETGFISEIVSNYCAAILSLIHTYDSEIILSC